MTDQPTDVAAVENDLAAANTLVAELQASISSGEAVDLDAFNTRIEAACQAAMALPRESMPSVRGALDQLLESLNNARDEIETARADLATEAEAAG